MFCLSKNLCAPVGSMVVGSKDFIARAKRYRRMLGGTMRQTGVLAAAGIIAMKEMTGRVGEDHKIAKLLASELGKLDIVKVKNDLVQTNFVPFTLTRSADLEGLKKYMFENKVKIRLPRANGVFRFATHYYIKQDHVYKVADLMRTFLRKF